jgi:hypothetical protein
MLLLHSDTSSVEILPATEALPCASNWLWEWQGVVLRPRLTDESFKVAHTWTDTLYMALRASTWQLWVKSER